MRQLNEVLRLRLGSGLSLRAIHRATGLSLGVVQKIIHQAEQQRLSWPLPESLNQDQLQQLFYPTKAPERPSAEFVQPDWSTLQQQLKRKGMTRQLLWEEYCQDRSGRLYSYSQFCERLRQWQKKQRRSMRQIHQAGEKLFVDYAGVCVPIINPDTGEILYQAAIFIGALGASHYTYAEATRSQSLPNWLQSHVRLFEFLGGTPTAVIPDNLRSAISKACRYDPETNPSYQQLAEHYQVAILPARPRKPKDKAKAEVAVQIVERWILMRLRHESFFSLGALNTRIRELLIDLNQRPFKQRPGNRQQAFEQLDQPALRALPRHPYQYVDIKTARVHIDYHIQYKDHYYSVPEPYVGEQIEVHASEQTLNLYFKGKHLATHVLSHGYGHTTIDAHMPSRHRHQAQWSAERLLKWAASIGPDTRHWVALQLHQKKHPEQAYRVCLGLLNLSKDYPSCRLNNACRLANTQGLVRLKHIKSILQTHRDQWQPSLDLEPKLPQNHENVRGPNSFK